MEARAINDILGMPKDRRLHVVAEGLKLISEHVETLHRDAKTLVASESSRGAAIIEGVAVEESGKALILFDYVRAGPGRQRQAARTLSSLYDHVARGVYTEIATFKPSDHADLRRMVEGLRVSHFLDGPNDIDWVFRNTLQERRERALYVDYVRYDGDSQWVSPEEWATSATWGLSRVPELVTSLRRAGLLSFEGLRLTEQAWKCVHVTDATRYNDVAAVTSNLVDAAHSDGLSASDFTVADRDRIVDSWSFPLFELDVRRRKVTLDELAGVRERAEQRYGGDSYD